MRGNWDVIKGVAQQFGLVRGEHHEVRNGGDAMVHKLLVYLGVEGEEECLPKGLARDILGGSTSLAECKSHGRREFNQTCKYLWYVGWYNVTAVARIRVRVSKPENSVKKSLSSQSSR